MQSAEWSNLYMHKGETGADRVRPRRTKRPVDSAPGASTSEGQSEYYRPDSRAKHARPIPRNRRQVPEKKVELKKADQLLDQKTEIDLTTKEPYQEIDEQHWKPKKGQKGRCFQQDNPEAGETWTKFIETNTETGYVYPSPDEVSTSMVLDPARRSLCQRRTGL